MFTGRPDYGSYILKTDSHKEENLKTKSPKQVTFNGTQLYRNVTPCKKKERGYVEIAKLDNS